MTTIGIIGMGRMGQAIAAQISSRQDIQFIPFSRLSEANDKDLSRCQVAIEFTIPEAAPGVIRHCLERHIPVVSGTTGWHEYHLSSILSLCKQQKGKMLYATNFSVGMNIVFALHERLSAVMASFPEFRPSIREVHHMHKKDAPSGTAYTLIESILSQHPAYTGFVLNPENPQLPTDRFPVDAIREGEVKGIHEVTWSSEMEKITIGHEAFDRRIFAEGAIMAALWLDHQPQGIYTMRDIIQL